MRNDFMTWEDWQSPSAQLKCMIQDLVCGLECNASTVKMDRLANNYISFSGPQGVFVFKEGGLSLDADNNLIAGSDGLAYFKENITDINSIGVVGTNLSITYTNETGSPQTKSVALTQICNACAGVTINPSTFLSTDAGNDIILGTDNKLFFQSAVNLTPVVDTFTVSAGNSVTLSSTPSTAQHIQIFRNGLKQRLGSDYSRTGLIVTFATAFGSSVNGAGIEEIEANYMI